MAKEKKPAKTCADCIHESACRVWTNGRYISDAAASQCPNHETVKESSAYLCGVLDERKRKQTNADRIRAMSDDELSIFVRAVVIADGCPNGDVDCKECPAFAICNQSGLYGHEMEWLKQPAEGDVNNV